MDVALYGAGGLGREMLELAMQVNAASHRWDYIIVIDDMRSDYTEKNINTYTFEEMCESFGKEQVEIVISVGEPLLRESLARKIVDRGYSLGSLIHPSAFVSESAQIGSGTIICYGSFISCGVTTGDNVLIQPLASIGHDCRIGSHSVISSYVSLSGNCVVGDRTYIGMSVPVKENITIGNDSIIGMGSVVLRDIQDDVIALGNPARPMKQNVNKKVFGSFDNT